MLTYVCSDRLAFVIDDPIVPAPEIVNTCRDYELKQAGQWELTRDRSWIQTCGLSHSFLFISLILITRHHNKLCVLNSLVKGRKRHWNYRIGDISCTLTFAGNSYSIDAFIKYKKQSKYTAAAMQEPIDRIFLTIIFAWIILVAP
jgi:hypothetical protein